MKRIPGWVVIFVACELVAIVLFIHATLKKG